MNVVNAIAKVRFSSARPQRVQIHKGRGLLVEMLCLESAQKLRVEAGERAYYVVTGTAVVSAGGEKATLPAGQAAAFARDEPHEIATAGDGRLILLALTRTG